MLNLTFRISHADFLPLANADVVSNGWKKGKAFAFSLPSFDAIIIIYIEIYKGKSLNSCSSVKPKSFSGAITKLEHQCPHLVDHVL